MTENTNQPVLQDLCGLRCRGDGFKRGRWGAGVGALWKGGMALWVRDWFGMRMVLCLGWSAFFLGCVPLAVQRAEPVVQTPAHRMFSLYQRSAQKQALKSSEVRDVAESLDDPNQQIRLQALRLLEKSSGLPRTTLLSVGLDQQLQWIVRQDPYLPARRLGIQLLATLRLPAEESLRTLDDIRARSPSAVDRTWAAAAMCALQGGAAVACRQLCDAMQDKQWIVRREAVRIQGLLGMTPSRCSSGVMGALGDAMIIVRYNAAFALGAIPAQSSLVVLQRLQLALLDLREPLLVTSAAYALCQKQQSQGCDLLLSLMRHQNAHIRLQASRAILLLQQRAERLIPDIERLLVHPEELVSVQAAYVLCRLGHCALPLDTLLRVLRRSPKKIQTHAEIALQRLSFRAVPALLEVFSQADLVLQQRILRLLGRMRWRAVLALPRLQAMIEQPSTKVLMPLLKKTVEAISAKP